jgi:hypothetical protein
VAVCLVAWTPSQCHDASNGSSVLRARVAYAGVGRNTITS